MTSRRDRWRDRGAAVCVIAAGLILLTQEVRSARYGRALVILVAYGIWAALTLADNRRRSVARGKK